MALAIESRFIEDELEDKVHEYLEIIARKIGVKIKTYPEVYPHYCRPILSEEDRKVFSELKKNKCLGFCGDVIIIGKIDKQTLAEEAAHYLHQDTSKLGYYSDDILHQFGVDAIIESVGYFCSKFLVPNKKLKPKLKKDIFKDFNYKKRKNILEYLKKREPEGDFVHDYGYLIGEGMWQEYKKGNYSLDEFRKLFCKNFAGSQSHALREFLKLRKRFLKNAR